MQITKDIIPIEDRRKFLKLGKENFFFDPADKFDPLRESQVHFKMLSLNLPAEYFENFLTPVNVTLYLLDYLKHNRKNGKAVHIEKETLRDVFTRWYLTKDKKEAEGIFAYLLKMSQSKNLSFVDELLATSFIVGNLEKIKDEGLIQAKLENISAYPPVPQLEMLNIITKLIRVFYHVKLGEWESAQFALDEFDSNKAALPNFDFYSMQVALNMGDVEAAQSHLLNLLKYDTDRLNYAVNTFNVRVFDTILENSFCKRVFKLVEGTILYDVLNNLIVTQKDDINKLNGINKDLKLLQSSIYLQFKSREIESRLDFLRALTTKYASTKSFLFISIIPYLQKKVSEITQEIVQNINSYFDAKVLESLKRYDEKINNFKEELVKLERDRSDFLVKEDAKNEKQLREFDEKMNGEIAYYQDLLNKFETQPDYNSFAVFKNAFGYNIIFSFFVLLTGGFAEFSNSYLSDMGNLASFLSVVLTGGIKWGFISFILGAIISIFLFINSTYDRHSKKGNLSQKINSLNLEKERARSVFTAKIEEKKKAINERYEKTKLKLNNDIEDFKEAREIERQRVLESLQEEKNSYTDSLNEILIR